MYLLLENGDFFLLENGDKLLLDLPESQVNDFGVGSDGVVMGVSVVDISDVGSAKPYALNFDGVFDFITVSSPGFNIQEFTISFWAEIFTQDSDAADQWNDLFSIVGASGGHYVMEIQGLFATNVGALALYRLAGFTGAGDADTVPDVRNTGVHHYIVTASVTGNYIRMYKDKVLVTSTMWSPASEVISTLTIGSRTADAGRSINAVFDNFRWFNVAMDTQLKIDNLYNEIIGSGLQGEYLFDKPTEGTAIDSSGNNRVGIFSGNHTHVAGYIPVEKASITSLFTIAQTGAGSDLVASILNILATIAHTGTALDVLTVLGIVAINENPTGSDLPSVIEFFPIAEGPNDIALAMSGINSSANNFTPASPPTVSDNVILSCWVRADIDSVNTASSQTFMAYGAMGLAFRSPTNDINFRYDMASAIIIGGSIGQRAKGWNHILGIYEWTGSQANLKLYLNGTLSWTGSNANIPTSVKGTRIGQSNAGVGFHGSLKKIRLWKNPTLPTDQQVRDLYLNETEWTPPTHKFLLDEGTGTTAIDTGTAGNNADLSILKSVWTTSQPGGLGALGADTLNNLGVVEISDSPSLAYLFDSTNYITVTANAAFNTSVFTYTAWIKRLRKGSSDTIKGNATTNGPQFRVEGGSNKLQLLKQNVIGVGFSNTPIIDNNWHHVAVSYDASGNYQYYLDGVADGNGTNLQTFAFANILIGQKTVGVEQMFGFQDEFRMYNRVLTLAEVQADMADNRPSSGLVLEYLYDTDGATVIDSSGNGFNGAITGTSVHGSGHTTHPVGLNTETLTIFNTLATIIETGTAVDLFTILALFTLTQTGSGSDLINFVILITITQTAVGADILLSILVTFLIAETNTVLELVSILSTFTIAQAGVGADLAIVLGIPTLRDRSNGYINFDANDDYITRSNIGQTSHQTKTVLMRIRPRTSGVGQGIQNMNQGSTNRTGLAITTANIYQIEFTGTGNSRRWTSPVIASNVWQDIAYAHPDMDQAVGRVIGDLSYFAINNVDQTMGSTSTGSGGGTGNNFTIGVTGPTNLTSDANMDMQYCYVFDHVLDSTERSDFYDNDIIPSGCILKWDAESSDDTTIYDSTINRNDGIISGATFVSEITDPASILNMFLLNESGAGSDVINPLLILIILSEFAWHFDSENLIKQIFKIGDPLPSTAVHLQAPSSGNSYNFSVDTDGSLKAVYNMAASASPKHQYIDLTSVSNYVIQAGDILEYEVMWTQNGDQVAVDLTNTDATNLRSTGLLDSNGLLAHPATDLSAYAVDQWYYRRFILPGSWVGKIVSFFDIVCEKDNINAETVTAYVRNIRIVNPALSILNTFTINNPAVGSDLASILALLIVTDSGISASQVVTILRILAISDNNLSVTEVITILYAFIIADSGNGMDILSAGMIDAIIGGLETILNDNYSPTILDTQQATVLDEPDD